MKNWIEALILLGLVIILVAGIIGLILLLSNVNQEPEPDTITLRENCDNVHLIGYWTRWQKVGRATRNYVYDYVWVRNMTPAEYFEFCYNGYYGLGGGRP